MQLRVILVGLLCFIAFGTKGQPIITQSDMPVGGDTLRISTATGNQGFNLDTTGLNITLDFSRLTPDEQKVIKYEDGLKTPYGFFFFNAVGAPTDDLALLTGFFSLVGFEASNVYNFYTTTNRAYSLTGRGITIGGFPAPTLYTDPDEIYRFPIRLGNRDSNTFRYVARLGDGPGYASAGRRRNFVDGTGTITTPAGTFECLRVRSIIDFRDTIFLPAGSPIPFFPIQYRRTEIKWLAKGQGLPVLQINRTQTNTGINLGTQILYKDINRLPIPWFTSPDIRYGCKPLTVRFQNTSLRANTYLWDFGDGTTSTNVNPFHVYTRQGEYAVTLTATNALGQTTVKREKFVVVDPFRVEFFVFENLIPIDNPTVTFFNATQRLDGSSTFRWDFGDGNSSTDLNPTHTYQRPGTYDVTLVGYERNGCTDSLTREGYIKIYDPVSRNLTPTKRTSFIYPNPLKSGQSLQISYVPENTQLQITDLQGKVVFSQSVAPGQRISVKLPTLQAGLYALTLTDGQHARSQIVQIID